MLVFPIGKWTKMCQGTRGRTPQKLVYVALKGAFKKRKKGDRTKGTRKKGKHKKGKTKKEQHGNNRKQGEQNKGKKRKHK